MAPTSTLHREPAAAEGPQAHRAHPAPRAHGAGRGFAHPRVRLVPLAEVAALLEPRDAAPLSAPPWVADAAGWSACALGWFDADGTLLAAVLVLRRHVPGSARFLAYLPSAPASAGPGGDPGWLPAATAVLRREGAFAVRVGGVHDL